MLSHQYGAVSAKIQRNIWKNLHSGTCAEVWLSEACLQGLKEGPPMEQDKVYLGEE